MRETCETVAGDEKWDRCRELLAELLKDPELQEHAQDWPVGGFDGKKVDNLLFYEDPDHGFVINGLIKNPGGLAVPHDHGKAWTVYGVLAGGERIVQMTPGENGFEQGESSECGPGDVDIVPPWRIHAEYAGDEKTIAVIVAASARGRSSNTATMTTAPRRFFPARTRCLTNCPKLPFYCGPRISSGRNGKADSSCDWLTARASLT